MALDRETRETLFRIAKEDDAVFVEKAIIKYKNDGEALGVLQQGLDKRPVGSSNVSCFLDTMAKNDLQYLLDLAVATKAVNPVPVSLHRLGKGALMDVFHAAAERFKNDKQVLGHIRKGVQDIDVSSGTPSSNFIARRNQQQKKSIIDAMIGEY